MTDAGRARLKAARRAGRAGELPESPQHRAWRQARTIAAERIDGFRARASLGSDEAAALLAARRRVGSDAWLLLAARLGPAYRQLGLATYCLYEWAEPDDARADIDDFDAGADDFIARPAPYLELRARLCALLRRTENPRPVQSLQIGPLEIDTGAYAASFHGDRLQLRHLEYELLLHLAAIRDECSASRRC